MENLKYDKKTLKKFGILMGIAFLVIAMLLFLRHRQNLLPVWGVSAIFFALAFLASATLKPLYILWMGLARVLNWIVTRVLLYTLFYLVLSVLGFILRLCGTDPLERKFNKAQESYWQKKDKTGFKQSDYEKRF